MIPPVCYNCGVFFGYLEYEFVKKLEKYDKSKYTNDEYAEIKMKLFKETGLEKYCCRNNFMVSNHAYHDVMI